MYQNKTRLSVEFSVCANPNSRNYESKAIACKVCVHMVLSCVIVVILRYGYADKIFI